MRIVPGEAIVALRSPDGPATLRVRSTDDAIEAEAWGPGAAWALESAPGIVGADDDDRGFSPDHEVVAEAWRRYRGVRLTRSSGVLLCLIPAILEQKVTGVQARQSYRLMVRTLGEPAPGPFALSVPPDPARLSTLPYFAFHPWGVERRRAELIRAVSQRAERIEAAAVRSPDEVAALLRTFRGIGPWTVAEVSRLALGDADAVSIGDFHLPHLVCWSLAGEPRGTDERMLQLLQPYRGQRGRVQRLLEAAHVRAPAFGPRSPAQWIAAL
jgi:3-methyladenine DNA glycosylase/8-oxoguanine DNA glycosylase